jgi:hypothetical protein
MKLTILDHFHVFVPQGQFESGPHKGEDKPDRKINFVKNQTIDEADLPEGQSAQDWIEKGLAVSAEAIGAGETPVPEAGPAV